MSAEQDSRVLSTPLPADLYERLRALAALHMMSNALVVDAVGVYLAEHGSSEELDALMAEVREKFMHSIDRGAA